MLDLVKSRSATSDIPFVVLRRNNYKAEACCNLARAEMHSFTEPRAETLKTFVQPGGGAPNSPRWSYGLLGSYSVAIMKKTWPVSWRNSCLSSVWSHLAVDVRRGDTERKTVPVSCTWTVRNSGCLFNIHPFFVADLNTCVKMYEPGRTVTVNSENMIKWKAFGEAGQTKRRVKKPLKTGQPVRHQLVLGVVFL